MYKLGIIGFGVVGKSVLAFLNRQHAGCTREHDLFDESIDPHCLKVFIWDSRNLVSEEREIIEMYQAIAVDASHVALSDFIKNNDYIIASPGIDLSRYKDFGNKLLCELDFFSEFFNKPVIAITGSLGKTTITKLLGKLVSSALLLPPHQQLHDDNQYPLSSRFSEKIKLNSVVGGNIGIGMLDLIQQQDAYDLGILELSSFQLELNKKFSPDIALWTNWFPNHLDRHASEQDYFEAKFNLIRFAKENQVAFLSVEMMASPVGKHLNDRLASLKSTLYFYTQSSVDPAFLATVKRDSFNILYIDGIWLTKATVHQGALQAATKIFNVGHLPDVTFLHNWVAVLGILYVLGIDLNNVQDFLAAHHEPLLDDHHHRLEHCATIKGVDFYDDSKSTIMESTLAAVEKMSLRERRIVLITGGLSKGVDRGPLMALLQQNPLLKKMYYFGNDCAAIADCALYQTLEEVMQDIAKIMEPGDIVLFSPGGSSFDLFKNYGHRGTVFKELIGTLDR